MGDIATDPTEEAKQSVEFPRLRVHHLLLWITTCALVITLCKVAAGMQIAAPWSLNGAYFLVSVVAWSLVSAVGLLALWWWFRNRPTLSREIGWLVAIPWLYFWEATVSFLTWTWVAESVLRLSEQNANLAVGVVPCILFVIVAVFVNVRFTTPILWRVFYLVAGFQCIGTIAGAVAFMIEADLPNWFLFMEGNGRVFVPLLMFAILTLAVWADSRSRRCTGVFYWAMVLPVGAMLLIEPAWVALAIWG